MSTQTLRDVSAIVEQVLLKENPFYSGVYPITDNAALLFFRKGDAAGWIDLAAASDAKLQALIEACEPLPPFGVQNDYTYYYPNSWRMDPANFATSLNVVSAGVVEHISAELVNVCNSEPREIRVELYELNIYGPGAFIGAHIDTARGDPEEWFGSLVVVFPTRHEGGVLQLRRGDKQWAFNTAGITSAQMTPSIACIALGHGVEHALSTVTSGYRVTLTYNICYDDEYAPKPLYPAGEEALQKSLSALISDINFMPGGGYLGFGLRYMYPIVINSAGGFNLRWVNNMMLKGRDAVIKRVLYRLGLCPELRIIYEVDVDEKDKDSNKTKVHILLDYDRHRFPEREYDGGTIGDALVDVGGVAVCEANYKPELTNPVGGPLVRVPPKKIHWVTPLTALSRITSNYVIYEDESSEIFLKHLYGDLCLVAEIIREERI